MRRFFFLICLELVAVSGFAQTFREKTNDLLVEFKDPSIDTSLPNIHWTNPQGEFIHSERHGLTIEAEVTSDVALMEITFSMIDANNDKRVKKMEFDPNATRVPIKQAVSLLDGQHVMTITATNIKGGQVSSTRTVLIGKDAIADAVSIDRKDYAILFATDKYDHWTDLVNPVEDANAIASELKTKYGFETEVIENANQEDVFIKIADYVQKRYKPQDQLFIFFAGHGYFDDTFGEGFVVAKNSLEDDKAKTSYISHSRLRAVINNIPCEHVFLTMDVCFGGTFDPMIAKQRGQSDTYTETTSTEFLVRKLSYRTRKYLTSGGKTYVSDGISGKHSPFALKLLQALKGGGGEDRILTLEELRSYVEKLIPEPRSGSFGDDNPSSDFVFVGKN